MPPALVLQVLEQDFPEPWLALSGSDQRTALRKAVEKGLRGGALYDAMKHGAKLISADRRAQPTYEAMGVQAEFVDP